MRASSRPLTHTCDSLCIARISLGCVICSIHVLWVSIRSEPDCIEATPRIRSLCATASVNSQLVGAIALERQHPNWRSACCLLMTLDVGITTQTPAAVKPPNAWMRCDPNTDTRRLVCFFLADRYWCALRSSRMPAWGSSSASYYSICLLVVAGPLPLSHQHTLLGDTGSLTEMQMHL